MLASNGQAAPPLLPLPPPPQPRWIALARLAVLRQYKCTASRFYFQNSPTPLSTEPYCYSDTTAFLFVKDIYLAPPFFEQVRLSSPTQNSRLNFNRTSVCITQLKGTTSPFSPSAKRLPPTPPLQSAARQAFSALPTPPLLLTAVLLIASVRYSHGKEAAR